MVRGEGEMDVMYMERYQQKITRNFTIDYRGDDYG